jgi:hypothetical protein
MRVADGVGVRVRVGGSEAPRRANDESKRDPEAAAYPFGSHFSTSFTGRSR